MNKPYKEQNGDKSIVKRLWLVVRRASGRESNLQVLLKACNASCGLNYWRAPLCCWWVGLTGDEADEKKTWRWSSLSWCRPVTAVAVDSANARSYATLITALAGQRWPVTPSGRLMMSKPVWHEHSRLSRGSISRLQLRGVLIRCRLELRIANSETMTVYLPRPFRPLMLLLLLMLMVVMMTSEGMFALCSKT